MPEPGKLRASRSQNPEALKLAGNPALSVLDRHGRVRTCLTVFSRAYIHLELSPRGEDHDPVIVVRVTVHLFRHGLEIEVPFMEIGSVFVVHRTGLAEPGLKGKFDLQDAKNEFPQP